MNSSEQIDRLKAEAVAADIRIANDALAIAGLTAERDALRAALVERDAKLAALEKQEPVAWLVYANGSHRYSTLTFDVSKVPDIYVGGDVVALYTAAGAAPFDPEASYQDHLDITVGIDSKAGAAPVPEGRRVTITRIANHLKKSPLGDISMYRNGFFDGAKWATKEAK